MARRLVRVGPERDQPTNGVRGIEIKCLRSNGDTRANLVIFPSHCRQLGRTIPFGEVETLFVGETVQLTSTRGCDGTSHGAVVADLFMQLRLRAPPNGAPRPSTPPAPPAGTTAPPTPDQNEASQSPPRMSLQF